MPLLDNRHVAYVHHGSTNIQRVYHGSKLIWPRWFARKANVELSQSWGSPNVATFDVNAPITATVEFITPDGTSHTGRQISTRDGPAHEWDWNIPNDATTHMVKIHVTMNGATQELRGYVAQHPEWAMAVIPVGGFVAYAQLVKPGATWFQGASLRTPQRLRNDEYHWHYHATNAGHDAIWITKDPAPITQFPPNALYFDIPTAPAPPTTGRFDVRRDTRSFAPLIGIHGEAASQWVKVQWNGNEELVLVAPDGQYWFYGNYGAGVVRVTEIGPPGRTDTAQIGSGGAASTKPTTAINVVTDETTIVAPSNGDVYVVGNGFSGINTGAWATVKPDTVVQWDGTKWVEITYQSGDTLTVNGRVASLERSSPGDTKTPLVWKYIDDHTAVCTPPRVQLRENTQSTIYVRPGVPFEWYVSPNHRMAIGGSSVVLAWVESPDGKPTNRHSCFTMHGGGIAKNKTITFTPPTTVSTLFSGVFGGSTAAPHTGGPGWTIPHSNWISSVLDPTCTFTQPTEIYLCGGKNGDLSPGSIQKLVHLVIIR